MISGLKTFKIGLSCQALCSFQNLLPQIFEIRFRHSRSIYFVMPQMDLKIELAEFQHKFANRFSQKDFDSII